MGYKAAEEDLKHTVLLRRDLAEITGNARRALVLNQMIYWSYKRSNTMDYLNEEIQRLENGVTGPDAEPGEYGWGYKSARELSDDLIDIISPRICAGVLGELVEMGYLHRRHHPKKLWDRTYHYRVHMTLVARDLAMLGREIPRYPVSEKAAKLSAGIILPDVESMEHDVESMEHDVESMEHDVESMEHDVGAIPETPPDTPSDTPSDTNGSSSGAPLGRDNDEAKEVEDEDTLEQENLEPPEPSENPEIVTESYREGSIHAAILDLDESSGTSIVSYLSKDAEARLIEIVHEDTLEGALGRLRHFVGLIRFQKVEDEEEETKLRGRVLRETFGDPNYTEVILTCSTSDLTDKLSALSRDYKPGPGSNVAKYWAMKLDDLVADDPTANQAASKVHEEVVSEQIEAKDQQRADDASLLAQLRCKMQDARALRAWDYQHLAHLVGRPKNIVAAQMGIMMLSDDKPAHDPRQTTQLQPLIQALHSLGEDTEFSDKVKEGLDRAGESQGIENAYETLCEMDYGDWIEAVGLDLHRIATLDGVAPGTVARLLHKYMPAEVRNRFKKEKE